MCGYCAIGEEVFVTWNGCNCSPRAEVDNETDRIHIEVSLCFLAPVVVVIFKFVVMLKGMHRKERRQP